jgi:zinc protease
MIAPPMHRRGVIVFALAALAGLPTRSSSQALDRAQRPEAPPEPVFKFPKIRMPSALSNGLRVYVVEDHSVPVVAVRVVTSADSTLDPVGKEGLYAVTIGALREGTRTRSAEQLAGAAADIGTDVRPTGFTTTTALFPRALELLADMLMHPRLDTAAVGRRKDIQAGAAGRIAQSTVTVPRRLFYAMLYGPDDPFVRSLVPTEASVGSITVADVAGFSASHLRPQTTSLVITGDVIGADAVAQVRHAFGPWPRGAAQPSGSSATGVVAHPTTIYLYDVPGTQAYLYVGAAGPARTSPESYAADVMSAIATARLQRALRDKRSFMYSGTIGFTWRRAARPSAFVGSTLVAAQNLDSALVEWLSMLRGLRGAEPITADELAAARRTRVASLAARIDGQDSLAARMVEMVRDTLPLDYFDQYAAHASSITAGELTAAAARIVDMEHLIIVVAGDRKIIEPALRAANLAPLVIVDANGRSISP